MTSLRMPPPSLRLSVPKLPASFDGRIHFVLGPGLGDMVNELRIVHEITTLYPRARAIVHADPRWVDLYASIPELARHELRAYPAGTSAGRDGGHGGTSYYGTFLAILGRIEQETPPGSSVVAVGALRLSDQAGRREAPLAMKARAIGLTLDGARLRPYCPLAAEARDSARERLADWGLAPGGYVALAPHTYPHKRWEDASWDALADAIPRTTGLAVLVIGVPGFPPIRGGVVREALGLPLPVVAALLAEARCTVGVDSGPAHLAACFERPVVTLNAQGRHPPFLVAPVTPLRWTHLPPCVYSARPIEPESVLEVVRRALEQPRPPACPLCAGVPYILGAGAGAMAFLCGCGLIFRDSGGVPDLPHPRDPRRARISSLVLPSTRAEFGSVRAMLSTDRPVELTFDHHDPQELDIGPLLEARAGDTLWWSFDAACRLARECGLEVRESFLERTEARPGIPFRVRLRVAPPASSDEDPVVYVPWDRRAVRLRRSSYDGWLAWGGLRQQDILADVGWLLLKERRWRHASEVLRLAWRSDARQETARFARAVSGALRVRRNRAL